MAVFVEALVRPHAPHARQGFVDGDSRQPCRKLRASVELPQMGVCIHVRLLHHVLGLALIPQNGAGRTINALVVPAHQNFEQRGVTREHTGDDFFVGQRIPSLQHGALTMCMTVLSLIV